MEKLWPTNAQAKIYETEEDSSWLLFRLQNVILPRTADLVCDPIKEYATTTWKNIGETDTTNAAAMLKTLNEICLRLSYILQHAITIDNIGV